MIRLAHPYHMWGKVNTLRQTYEKKGAAGRCIFTKSVRDDSDYILLSMTSEPEREAIKRFSRERRIIVVMENPSVWKPKKEILENAGIILSPFRESRVEGSLFMQCQPCIPWFYGIEFDTKRGLEHVPLQDSISFEEICNQKPPVKNKLLSVIVSGKSGLPGYEWRKKLAERLKNYYGIDCDVYGFGHNALADKREALDSYAFTLVIENESRDFYWTEKLADAYLGYCYPIYSGDPRVQDDFSAEISQVKFGSDLDKAMEKIKRVIALYSADYVRQVAENRNRVLFRHNLFYFLDSYLHGN